jgi:cation diffusion facilitator CzcD-associated flavoprotein CzcO
MVAISARADCQSRRAKLEWRATPEREPPLPADPSFADSPPPEVFDVLIVGAGLSGVGAAHRLQRRCPGKRYAILEARDAIGGTWDLFRYPGIRSDSDMYTLGYDFKPWTDPKAIADGPTILRYIRETAQEAGIVPHIRFGHTVRSAQWRSGEACWTVRAERRADGIEVELRTRFLYVCSGYYDYARGHRPTFAGESEFTGRIVHAQFWPEDLDYAGRRVVVVGSGATAVTIVPEMALTAAQVTMLQRSPSFILTRPARDGFALWLERRLPTRLAYALTRWKNVLVGMAFFQLSRRRPAFIKRYLVGLARRQAGPAGTDVRDWTPRYDPWDQRLCLVPDGDLFRRLREGRAAIVTDTIERFTAGGLRLASGRELAADIVVLATGLELRVLGGMSLRVDSQPVDIGRAIAYKGMMLSDLPNLALAFGYANASWTLKADLTSAYVCRLLRYMDRHGHAIAVARRDPYVQPLPFLSFTSGYVRRSVHFLPKQGSRRPWQVYQNYLLDLLTIRWGRLADGVLQFSSRAADKPLPP